MSIKKITSAEACELSGIILIPYAIIEMFHELRNSKHWYLQHKAAFRVQNVKAIMEKYGIQQLDVIYINSSSAY